MICSTNAIESSNARYRRAVKARGRFPDEQPALNAFAITFANRFPAAETC